MPAPEPAPDFAAPDPAAIPGDLLADLQACLDQGRDPLDDAALCARLGAAPAALAAYARWRERLAALPAVVPPALDPPVALRRPRWPYIGAAAVALLAVGAAVWALRAPGVVPVAAPAAAAAAGFVHAASLEVIRPRLGIALGACATERLVQQPGARLEVFAQWSTP